MAFLGKASFFVFPGNNYLGFKWIFQYMICNNHAFIHLLSDSSTTLCNKLKYLNT